MKHKYTIITILLLVVIFFFTSCIEQADTAETDDISAQTQADRGTVQTDTTEHTTSETASVTDSQEESDTVLLTDNATESTDITATVPAASATTVLPSAEDSAAVICRKYSATAVQLAVIEDGIYSYSYVYGTANKADSTPVNEDTKYRIASLSKLVTDTVFMALADKGLVSEDADISTYLGYEVRNPSYEQQVITPQMLMTHTSSIIDSSAFLAGRQNGSSTPIKTLLSSSSSFSGSCPGKAYSYSNFGVAVIGAICETVTGRGFNELAKEYIFTPLGIDASFIAAELSDTSLLGVLYGSSGMSAATQLAEHFHEGIGQTYHLVQGNLTVSAKDYAKIVGVLMNNGATADGVQIISPKNAQAICTEHFSSGSVGIGYGVEMHNNVIPEQRLCVHTGSNFGMYAAFAFSPQSGDGVIVLTCGADGGKDYETDIYEVCLALIQLFYPRITKENEYARV